jgi:glycosyltransferase involved in cell wall biosynthesis
VARFAVCIPVYNGAAFVAQALESVAQQTHPDVEVVVSDNASTDATPAILAAWSDRLNLRIIRRPRTLPMRDHFNALLDEVDSEAYMLLCHDDYLASPDALEQAQAALDAHPEVSAVYCDLVYVDERRRPLSTRRFGRDGSFRADDIGRRTLRTGRNCFGIPLAVRREALGSHRYDERFLYSMDVDLSWTISRESPAFHIPQTLIANRYSGQNTTWSLLATARREYIDLTAKYGQAPGALERLRIGLICFAVAQTKRVFGLYERVRSWAG